MSNAQQTTTNHAGHWSLRNRTHEPLSLGRVALPLGRSNAGLGRLTVRDASRVLGLSCGSQH